MREVAPNKFDQGKAEIQGKSELNIFDVAMVMVIVVMRVRLAHPLSILINSPPRDETTWSPQEPSCKRSTNVIAAPNSAQHRLENRP